MAYRLWVQSRAVLERELEMGQIEGIWDAQDVESMSWSKIKGILSKDPVGGTETVDIIIHSSGKKVGEAHFKVLEVVEAI